MAIFSGGTHPKSNVAKTGMVAQTFELVLRPRDLFPVRCGVRGATDEAVPRLQLRGVGAGHARPEAVRNKSSGRRTSYPLEESGPSFPSGPHVSVRDGGR